jgi:hypothetical protein
MAEIFLGYPKLLDFYGPPYYEKSFDEVDVGAHASAILVADGQNLKECKSSS